VSSEGDDENIQNLEDLEDLEELDAPEEPVPQPDEKDYDTDDDLYYASDSDDEPEERIQRLPYGFALLWRIEDSKKKTLLESANTITLPKRLFAPLDDFQQWYRDQMLVNLHDYRFTELYFKASYDNGDESEASTVKGDQDGYYQTINKLVRWSIRSYRNVTMTLTARVKKMPPAAATLARSTVRRAESRVPDLRTKLGTGGHPAAQIRRQWICKWPDCERYKRTCWWGVKNLPEYHVPIRRAHIHSWSCGIFDGKLTPQDPGGALMQRMMRLQHAQKTAIAPAPPVQDLNINLYGMASTSQQTIRTDGLNLQVSFYGPEYSHGHVLGGYSLPESPYSDVEQFDRFKAWCLDYPSWHGERSQVERIMRVLDDNDYDVEQIAYISAAEWDYRGLHEAYRIKMSQSAETWMILQGAVRRLR
jgi:hypothetical protein